MKSRYAIVIWFIAIVFALSSCNSRQARIASKVIHEINHANETSEGNSDESAFETDENISEPSTETKELYETKGISYDKETRYWLPENSWVTKLNNDLYFCNNPQNYICRNDVSTLPAEPTLADVPVNGGKTPDVVSLDVSMYDYKCDSDGKIHFFNIIKRMEGVH